MVDLSPTPVFDREAHHSSLGNDGGCLSSLCSMSLGLRGQEGEGGWQENVNTSFFRSGTRLMIARSSRVVSSPLIDLAPLCPRRATRRPPPKEREASQWNTARS